MRRTAKTYSIVDHELYHSGYLSRLSHSAMAAYLFYLVVSDLDGKSFWSVEKARAVLRMSGEDFSSARAELLREGLIQVAGKIVILSNLKQNGQNKIQRPKTNDSLPQRQREPQLSPNRTEDWTRAKEVLRDIFKGV